MRLLLLFFCFSFVTILNTQESLVLASSSSVSVSRSSSASPLSPPSALDHPGSTVLEGGEGVGRSERVQIKSLLQVQNQRPTQNRMDNSVQSSSTVAETDSKTITLSTYVFALLAFGSCVVGSIFSYVCVKLMDSKQKWLINTIITATCHTTFLIMALHFYTTIFYRPSVVRIQYSPSHLSAVIRSTFVRYE